MRENKTFDRRICHEVDHEKVQLDLTVFKCKELIFSSVPSKGIFKFFTYSVLTHEFGYILG